MYIQFTIVIFIVLMLGASCRSPQKKWGASLSPNTNWQVLLKQKERTMHQAPEILVYYKSKNKAKSYPIGNIVLPEDNRNKLDYHCEWNNDTMNLTITCDYCMIEERYYSINFEDKEPKLTRKELKYTQ